MADLGELYRRARLRIVDLVDDEVADRAVPATPAWTVHDVIAHVAGVAEDDAMTGNMAGSPGEVWTAAQVARGEVRSITDLVAQ